MIRPVSPFMVATIAPIPLLFLGGIFGGIFILAAFLYMTVLTMVLDSLIHTSGPKAAPGVEWPMAEQLSLGLAAAHFPLLLLGIAAVTGITGLGFLEGLLALLAFGMFFGQVSNSNAHELIHKTDKMSFNAGKWVLISLLFGHHVTAHLRIHHRYVGTPQDPNTAVLGESFWAFAMRAWGESFAAGWEIENSMAEVKGEKLPIWKHPYAEYIGGAAGIMFFVLIVLGFSGLMGFLLLAAYAQMQLLLSDYVQHYGLRRRKTGDDTYETVAPWHSWNAANWFSGGLMLNATRHSDHHVNPGRSFPELSLPDALEGPRLPYSLPVMAAIAMVPSKWERLMNHRAMEWQERIDEGAIMRNRAPTPVSASEAGFKEVVNASNTDAVADRVNAALSNDTAQTSAGAADEPNKQRKPGLRRATSVARELESSGKSRRRNRENTDDFSYDAELEAAPLAAASALASAAPADAKDETVDVTNLLQEEPAPEEHLVARGSDLWNVMDDDDDPVGASKANGYDAPVQSDADLTSAIRAAEEEVRESDALPAKPQEEVQAVEEAPAAEDAEDAIADVMGVKRKADRRKSEKFPVLEPAEEDKIIESVDLPAVSPEKVHTSPVKVVKGAGLAARSFAAVMRGAPPGRPGKRPQPER